MGTPQTSPLELPPAAAAEQLTLRSFGPFTFDPGRRLLSKDGQEIAVPPRVLAVLDVLLQHAGEVVPKQALIDTVWKDAFVTDTSLAEAISALRQTLDDDPQEPTYIQTLHRRGYRFVAPISAAAEQGARIPAAPAVEPTAPVSPSIARGLVPWSVATLCAVLAVAAVWQYTRRAPNPTVVSARFTIAPVPGTRFDDVAPALAISPDGSVLAWSGCDATDCRIYVRPLESVDITPLAATRGAHAPFFSPDGQWIAYFADGRLMKIATRGGTPTAIADAPTPLGGAWIAADIVFAGSPSGGLMRVAAEGGEPRPLTTPNESAGEVRHAWPSLVPDTRALLFIVETVPALDAPGSSGVLASLSLDTIAAARAQMASWRTLFSGVTVVRGAARDAIVFGRDAEILGVKFDPLRLVASGVPKTLVGDVATARSRADFALAATGTLVHAVKPHPAADDAAARTATGESMDAPLSRFRDATLSPDGTRVAGISVEGARSELWTADVRRGAAVRIMHTGISASPAWAPDGRTVYFANRTDGAFAIWRGDAAGGSAPVRVYGGDRHAFPLSVSPDGSRLAVLSTAASTRADILLIPLAGGPPRALVQTPFDEGAASFSPDSTMIAYQSAATGRWEIYVQRITDGRQLVVSTNGGERPVWTRDGLFYQSKRSLVRAAVASRPEGPFVESTADASINDAERQALQDGAVLQGVAPGGRLLLAIPGGRGIEARGSTAIVSLDWLRRARSLLGPPEAQLPR